MRSTRMRYNKIMKDENNNEIQEGSFLKFENETQEEGFVEYGGFWRRFLAYAFDQSIFTLFIVLVFFILAMFFGLRIEDLIQENSEFLFTTVPVLALIVLFIGGVGPYIYHAIFTSSHWQATPGKRLFGLKVVDAVSHGRISFWRSLGRSFAYILSSAFFNLGFIWAAFDNKKRTWHDMLLKTRVMKSPYNVSRAIAVLLLVWFACIALVVGIVVIVSLVYFRSGAFSEFPLLTYERDINNISISINEDLFRESSINVFEIPEDFLREGLKNYLPSEGRELQDLKKIDVNKEISAVVALDCPIGVDGIFSNTGSGVIIHDQGLILTSNHVLEDTGDFYCSVGFTNDLSKEPEFIFYADNQLTRNGEEFPLVNKELDVVILKIISAELGYAIPLKFPTVSVVGESDLLNINENLSIAGYPAFGGGTITLTNGVVSGRLGNTLIKTSAKIDEGNSGGAAFNEIGHFVGIPTLIYEGASEGLGYIVGVDAVRGWLNDKLEILREE